MRMLRLACLVVLPLFSLSLPALGADFPPLYGPTVYAGKLAQGDDLYDVLLVLGEDQEFLLKENFVLPNGKHSGWEATGKWHQVRGGAFVQLTNQDDFQRMINVGGSGNLYLGAQMPAGLMATVTLRLQPNENYAGELASLALLDASKTVVSPKRVLEAVKGNRWKVVRFGDGARAPKRGPGYVLSFLPGSSNGGGEMEVFDGLRHVMGSYTLRDSGVSLSAGATDSGFARLIRETRSWSLAGDVLELWGKDRMLAVLEKTY